MCDTTTFSFPAVTHTHMTLTCHRFFGLLTHLVSHGTQLRRKDRTSVLWSSTLVSYGTWYTARCLYWTRNALNYCPSWIASCLHPHPWCLDANFFSPWFTEACNFHIQRRLVYPASTLFVYFKVFQ